MDPKLVEYSTAAVGLVIQSMSGSLEGAGLVTGDLGADALGMGSAKAINVAMIRLRDSGWAEDWAALGRQAADLAADLPDKSEWADPMSQPHALEDVQALLKGIAVAAGDRGNLSPVEVCGGDSSRASIALLMALVVCIYALAQCFRLEPLDAARRLSMDLQGSR